jgi:lipid-A-disaccharide synthase-like uncharacterized protein
VLSDNYVWAIGLFAQGMFSARLLVQWLASERAKKVRSPIVFWQLSLMASFLLMIYGALRLDPIIIAGQVISYFIYIRNLRLKRAWRFIPLPFRAITLAFPAIAFGWLIFGSTYSWDYILEHNKISWELMSWGGVGQAVFTARFVYQWYFSEKKGRSILPAGFWIISLIGSTMILVYAVFREDPALFVGHIFGTVVYVRNLMLLRK